MTADFSRKSSISLRAEVLILLLITIFGIIGLSVCIGLNSGTDNIAGLSADPPAKSVMIYDRQAKT